MEIEFAGMAERPLAGALDLAQHRRRFLADDDRLRQGIRAYSNWPTIPRLYVNGELVGGCDIVREIYEAGELRGMLAKALPSDADVGP